MPFPVRRALVFACGAVVALGLANLPPLGAAELRLNMKQGFLFRPQSENATQTIQLRLRLLPEEDVGSVTDGQGYEIKRQDGARELVLNVQVKHEHPGITSLGPFTLRINGEEFHTPAFKVAVLPVLAKDSGLTIVSLPDPNDTGRFVVNVEDHHFLKGRKGEDLVEVTRDKLPSGIITSQSASWSDTFSSADCYFTNETGKDFVLLPEHFKNLPEGYEMPRIVIPPTPKQAAGTAAD